LSCNGRDFERKGVEMVIFNGAWGSKGEQNCNILSHFGSLFVIFISGNYESFSKAYREAYS
jgi:hypothetical protein